ncbi:MAG TPA: 2Fe-2S iron-sulfur cluster-binding protein [Vicinamibacterales bacterium]|nr:2Fe-2S iron-sulfur cluster-binding protein [Vicinamibacterales bacterium]
MFQSFLKQHDAAAWQRTIEGLLPHIHDVDRNATQVWFHFFPLQLAQAIAESDNLAQLALTLRLEGAFNLADQVDSSHWFLYGHRYWPDVKAAIVQRAAASTAPSSLELAAVIHEIAADVSRRVLANTARPTSDVTLGIAAVGLMTLQQVGLEAFRAGSPNAAVGVSTKTPEQIVAARKKNDSQGLAGIFRGIRAQYTVTFDERRPDACFTIINQQHLTTASANDKRDYSSAVRGTVEGPIPAQCRTQSCGTCWVGILGGNENLSPVDAHEKKRMREFGYILSDEPRPVIRLACAALASGNVTIVIPPWNGFIGKRKGSRETSAALPPR